jgi:hypothetical protein
MNSNSNAQKRAACIPIIGDKSSSSNSNDIAYTHIFHALAPMHTLAKTIFKTHLHTIVETIMLTTMNSINCTSTEMLSFHQFSLQNRTEMLLITLHKYTVVAHGISITCSFLITMQHTSTHSRKRKQTNIHTASHTAAAPITSRQKRKHTNISHSSCTWFITIIAGHTRQQTPSTHGTKENKQGCTWYIIIEHIF